MSNNPIQNPGSSPIQPTQPPAEDKPALGADEDAQPRPFSLPPTAPDKTAEGVTPSAKPTPMDVAKDSTKSPEWTQEEMASRLNGMAKQLGTVQNKLQAPNVGDDHYNAMGKVIGKLNPDMQGIAKMTGGQFTPPTQDKSSGMLSYISNWLNQGQGALTQAANSVAATTGQPTDLASFMQLQMTVQKASQRVELLSTIVSSSVSGVKTLMSMQLG